MTDSDPVSELYAHDSTIDDAEADPTNITAFNAYKLILDKSTMTEGNNYQSLSLAAQLITKHFMTYHDKLGKESLENLFSLCQDGVSQITRIHTVRSILNLCKQNSENEEFKKNYIPYILEKVKFISSKDDGGVIQRHLSQLLRTVNSLKPQIFNENEIDEKNSNEDKTKIASKQSNRNSRSRSVSQSYQIKSNNQRGHSQSHNEKNHNIDIETDDKPYAHSELNEEDDEELDKIKSDGYFKGAKTPVPTGSNSLSCHASPYVFIGNVWPTIKKSDVIDFFQEIEKLDEDQLQIHFLHGPPSRNRIGKDIPSHVFISFSNRENAKKAIKLCMEKEIMEGRKINANFSRGPAVSSLQVEIDLEWDQTIKSIRDINIEDWNTKALKSFMSYGRILNNLKEPLLKPESDLFIITYEDLEVARRVIKTMGSPGYYLHGVPIRVTYEPVEQKKHEDYVKKAIAAKKASGYIPSNPPPFRSTHNTSYSSNISSRGGAVAGRGRGRGERKFPVESAPPPRYKPTSRSRSRGKYPVISVPLKEKAYHNRSRSRSPDIRREVYIEREPRPTLYDRSTVPYRNTVERSGIARGRLRSYSRSPPPALFAHTSRDHRQPGNRGRDTNYVPPRAYGNTRGERYVDEVPPSYDPTRQNRFPPEGRRIYPEERNEPDYYTRSSYMVNDGGKPTSHVHDKTNPTYIAREEREGFGYRKNILPSTNAGDKGGRYSAAHPSYHRRNSSRRSRDGDKILNIDKREYEKHETYENGSKTRRIEYDNNDSRDINENKNDIIRRYKGSDKNKSNPSIAPRLEDMLEDECAVDYEEDDH